MKIIARIYLKLVAVDLRVVIAVLTAIAILTLALTSKAQTISTTPRIVDGMEISGALDIVLKPVATALTVLAISSVVHAVATVSAPTITKLYDGTHKIRIDGYSGTELKPCYVFFPGGGFVSQNWSICNTWSTIAVSQGFVSCKVGYSTTFYPTLPAANKGILDCVNAVKWIKAHASTYHIDTNQIYLAGTSAGGFCALGVAYQHSVNVAGVLNGWGAILDLGYLANNNTPVYNVSTDIDKIVPVECGTSFGVQCCGSQAITNELGLLGIPNEWLVWEGYKHGLLPKDSEYTYRVEHSFYSALLFFTTQ